MFTLYNMRYCLLQEYFQELYIVQSSAIDFHMAGNQRRPKIEDLISRSIKC